MICFETFGFTEVNIAHFIVCYSKVSHAYNSNGLIYLPLSLFQKMNAVLLSSSDNYRGISLFNALCKLFNDYIMQACIDYLYTSDMQFGF